MGAVCGMPGSEGAGKSLRPTSTSSCPTQGLSQTRRVGESEYTHLHTLHICTHLHTNAHTCTPTYAYTCVQYTHGHNCMYMCMPMHIQYSYTHPYTCAKHTYTHLNTHKCTHHTLIHSCTKTLDLHMHTFNYTPTHPYINS